MSNNLGLFIILSTLLTAAASADIYSAAEVRKANKAIKNGDYQTAQDIYSRMNNNDPKIIFNKGYLEAASGNYEESENYYKIMKATASSSDKMKAKGLYNLANDKLKQRDINNAVKYYREALLLDPGNRDIIHNLEIANNAELVKQMPKAEQSDQDSKGKDKQDQKQGETNGKDKSESQQQGDNVQQDRGKQKNIERILDSFKDDELKAIQETMSKQELKNDIEKDW